MDQEKPLHKTHLSEEHSPGGRHVIIQVSHKEKTSQEQTHRLHHKVQTIHEPQERKDQVRLKRPKRLLWNRILWTDGSQINQQERRMEKNLSG